MGMVRQLRRVMRPFKGAAVAAWKQARWRRRYHRLTADLRPEVHLRALADWLVRAQDAGADRGVAYGACLGGDFQASYPETTGYIIPTFMALARYYGDDAFRRRAVEMGDWEIAVQMPCGAVMGGHVNPNPTPAVFNTGQVLLGWSALYRATKEPRFLDAARRACDWLLGVQEPDGNWFKGNSAFANPQATVYNVKAAWGLCAAGLAGVGDRAVAGAVRNAEYCLTRQTANGWFADCCLGDPAEPLLHTLAYTMQGLVGIGLLANRPDFVQAAERTARGLMRLMDADGFLPGKIDAQFRGTVSWCCLTGTAQTSIVWSQLAEITCDDAFRDARRRANRYLMQRHNLTDANPAVRGGVFGSWPVWGPYGELMVLNWAAKYMADALLLELRPDCLTTDTHA